MKLGSFTSGWHYEAKKVQKSVMHLRSCCFAYLNVHFFAILVALLSHCFTQNNIPQNSGSEQLGIKQQFSFRRWQC